MILYDYPRSSASYRVRIALALKGLDHERRLIDLRAGDQRGDAYRAVTPAGLVPALVLDDGTVLTQSLAIIRYLDTLAGPPLLPADPIAAARVEAMALAIACDIHPLNNLRVLNYLEGPLGADKAARDAWYAHWVREGLLGLEAEVGRWSGAYCHGDAVGLADVCLVPQLANARRFAVPLDGLERLVAIDARLRALPAFAAAAPADQS